MDYAKKLADIETVVNPEHVPPRIMPLSPQEKTIFGYLGMGMSRRDIACVMALSSKTIDTYAERVRIKLGLHSREQVIALAAVAAFVEQQKGKEQS